MTTELLMPFILASVVIEATPGPNMGYLAILSLSDGRRAGLSAVAGVALGLLIVGIAAALGVAAVVSELPFMFRLLHWGGVAYLFWLAWEGWQPEAETAPESERGMITQAKFFRRGLITNLLNPKAALFYIAILPTFVDARSSAMTQAIFLTVLYVAIATLVHGTIVTLAATARPLLESPERRQPVRRALALLLALIALWLAFSMPTGV